MLDLVERLHGAALLAGIGARKLPGNLWGIPTDNISATSLANPR